MCLRLRFYLARSHAVVCAIRWKRSHPAQVEVKSRCFIKSTQSAFRTRVCFAGQVGSAVIQAQGPHSGATRLFWSRYIMSPIKVVSNESRCSQCRPQKCGRATQSKVRWRHAGTRSVTPKQHVHEEQIGPPVSWTLVDSVCIIAEASWFGSFWTNKCTLEKEV